MMLQKKKLFVDPKEVFEHLIHPESGDKFVTGKQNNVVEFADVLFNCVGLGLEYNQNVSFNE